jgi:hypothetical protein
MQSPHLLQAFAIAGRVDQLRAEADRERLAKPARRARGWLAALRELAGRVAGSGWPTAAPIPGLRDYPHAGAGR